MATITPTISKVDQTNGKAAVITWADLTTTNADGAPAEWADYADRTIQFHGTFGTGGTIKLQGSNDGTNWYEITDPQGNAISKTAAGIEACTEVTRFVRPFVSAGDGTTSLTATLFLRRETR